MNVFETLDYRDILRTSLLEKKSVMPESYSFQKMAKHCRVAKTYLSAVLGGKGDLNSDQVYRSSVFLGFTSEETDYVLTCLDYHRSADRERRDLLKRQLVDWQKSKSSLENRVKAKAVEATNDTELGLYLDPLARIVLMFLNLPEYRLHISKISRDLRIAPSRLHEILHKLETGGFVRLEKGQYVVSRDQFHLPASHQARHAVSALTRMRTMERLQNDPHEQDYSFNVTFTTSADVREEVRKRFVSFLEDVEELVKDSPDEVVMQMGFDLFQWNCDGKI